MKAALDERDAARAALADAGDERGALTVALAERDARLSETERARERLAEQLASLERRTALEAHDRVALATRLKDRDAELQRAIAVRDRADAALAAERRHHVVVLEAEATRRRTEADTHADELSRLRAQLDEARTELADTGAARAHAEALLEAECERTVRADARLQTLDGERDAALRYASVSEAQLDRAHRAVADARHSANVSKNTATDLHAHATRLRAQLDSAGVDPNDIEASPPLTLLDVPVPPLLAYDDTGSDIRDDERLTISIVDLADVAAIDDDSSETGTERGSSASRRLLPASDLSRFPPSWALPNPWERIQIEDAVAAVGRLPTDLTATVSDMARRGDLGVAAAIAERPDIGSLIDSAATLSNPVAELVRSVEAFMGPEQSFLEDIRLTEKLLAGTDLRRLVDEAGNPAMVSLLADMDKVSSIARRAFETYAITPEQFRSTIDSLGPSELDARVRRTTTQLREQARRRGWTTPASAKAQSSVHEPDVLTPPPEIEEVLADAPDEQVGAFRRLLKAFNTNGAVTLSSIAVVVVTIVALLDDDVSLANTASGDVDIRATNVQGDIDVVNNNTINVGNDVLDILNDDPNARAELMRELCKLNHQAAIEPDEPVESTELDEPSKGPDVVDAASSLDDLPP